MPAGSRPALVLAASLALLGRTDARAAAHPERRCARAASAVGARVLEQVSELLASCADRVRRGRLPADTDCADETARARARVLAGVAKRLRRSCRDSAVVALAAGGACTGATTVPALVACLGDSHDAAAAILQGVTDGNAATVSASTVRCQREASRQARSYAVARLRVLQRCRQRPPRDLLPGMECRNDSGVEARLTKLQSRATRKIAGKCTADALASARFGAPCARPSGAEALARCLLAAADSAGDEVIMAEFRNPGFCGEAAPAVETRIDDLLGKMTLAEKIAQMHGIRFITGKAWATNGVERLGVPGFGMIDGPRGVSILSGGATAFPVAMARGATWDLALEERVGEAIGAEARARGASVILAPVLNILRHPRWGRAQETYGEDTVHLGSMGIAFIRGAQRHVIASAKHFAANSIENTRFTVDVSVDERSLREVYLPHFRRAVEEGHVGSIMSAYNLVNGHYCAENSHLLHDILKGEWAFQGFVESDWILGTRSTAPSANAGLDIEMPTPKFYGDQLAEAVAAGEVSEATIDAAVRRILRTQLCFRIDTDPPAIDPTASGTQAHANLALEVAQKSLVLLRNESGTLPLNRAGLGSLVVVGALAATENIGDTGSSNVGPAHVVTPLDGIRAAAGSAGVTHVATFPFSSEDQSAIAAADAAIVVVGLTADDEGESIVGVGDRANLALPGDQDAMVAAVAALNARTIVVLEGGSALTLPWVDDVAAILLAWYPGQEGGSAIGGALFGDVVPSGKLPISFARDESDLPEFRNGPDDLAVTYDYWHGYRLLDRAGKAPLFPFGFGLSYTTFRYANLKLSAASVKPAGQLRVTVDVTNTGGVAGDEIAQLYVGYEGSRVERAVNDLKAFDRVHLDAGETRTVTFDLRAADLAFWDVTAGAWEVEPIGYVVRVGPSSRDLPLEARFRVPGDAS